MKMTMHIDETILEEVMEMYGCVSKTEAVDFALKELVRKKKLRAFAKTGLGMTPDELGNAFYPDYDVLALRVAKAPAKKEPNGKRRSR